MNLLNVFDYQYVDLSLDLPGESEKQDNNMVVLEPELQHWVNVIELVNKSNNYNVFGEQIQLTSTWNIQLLTDLLHDYHDNQIVDFFKLAGQLIEMSKYSWSWGAGTIKGQHCSRNIWTGILKKRFRWGPL